MYILKDANGFSPYACIDSGDIAYELIGSDELQTPMVLVIGFWARRGATDEHDVMLDDLAWALATMLRAKYTARTATKSVTDFEELDGVSYKFELHFIEFMV